MEVYKLAKSLMSLGIFLVLTASCTPFVAEINSPGNLCDLRSQFMDVQEGFGLSAAIDGVNSVVRQGNPFDIVVSIPVAIGIASVGSLFDFIGLFEDTTLFIMGGGRWPCEQILWTVKETPGAIMYVIPQNNSGSPILDRIYIESAATNCLDSFRYEAHVLNESGREIGSRTGTISSYECGGQFLFESRPDGTVELTIRNVGDRLLEEVPVLEAFLKESAEDSGKFVPKNSIVGAAFLKRWLSLARVLKPTERRLWIQLIPFGQPNYE